MQAAENRKTPVLASIRTARCLPAESWCVNKARQPKKVFFLGSPLARITRQDSSLYSGAWAKSESRLGVAHVRMHLPIAVPPYLLN